MLFIILGILATQLTWANNSEATPEHLMIQNILKNSGVLEIIYQVPDWIEQEIDNLEATPVPFDSKELEFVREDLETGFSTASLKKQLIHRLSQSFTLEELKAINEVFKKPEVKKFQNLQEGTQSDYIKADIRSYKAKLKNVSPRGSRVEMMRNLDSSLQQSKLEADLKVELRKSLLTSVSWIKSKEVLEEKTLEQELSAYRERVGEEINSNALIFYLYLFKRTPSDQLGNLVESFNSEEFSKFMAICHEVMLSSIKEARRRIPDNIKLAGND